MKKKVYQKRFQELETELKELFQTKRSSYDRETNAQKTYVDNQLFIKWKIKVKEIISQIFKQDSSYYIQFEKREEGWMYSTNHDTLLNLQAVFLAAKEDFEGGYASSLYSMVQAEVFDSELEQAQELLKNNYLSAAFIA